MHFLKTHSTLTLQLNAFTLQIEPISPPSKVNGMGSLPKYSRNKGAINNAQKNMLH